MKKQFLLVLALISLMSVFSFSIVSAQDEEELPACDPMTAMTNLQEILAPLEDLADFTMDGEATGSDYSALVAEIDAYVVEYWTSFEETEFECAEEQFIAYSLGLALDEFLIVTELSALAVHESLAGNEEAATTFSELATTRSETLTEDMTAFTDVITDLMTGEVEMGNDLDACSEEEITATGDGILEINEAYIELGESIEGATGDDLSAVVAGFATLSSEYWATFVPEVPECAEAQEVSTAYGLLLDESLIMVGLLRLADLEATAGNDELATTLAESAMARAEGLAEMAEEMMGEEE